MVANLTTKLGQLVDVLTPDTTNTRIGVANASPTRTLDVTGTFGASGASTLGGALTYGGVTLSNAVTGTGNMVLSASPTLTGTLTGAQSSWSGGLTFTGAGTNHHQIIYDDTGYIYAGNAKAFTIAMNGVGNMLAFDTSRNATFSGTLTGAAATFSSTLGVTGASITLAPASGNSYIYSSRATQSTGQVAFQLSGGTSGTDWIIYQPTSSNNLTFFGNSADRMTLTSAGNLGIGLSPNAWGANYPSIQFGIGGGIGGSKNSGAALIYGNLYYDGTNYKYINTDYGTVYQVGTQNHIWYNAPSGTAGNSATIVEAARIDASGNLLVGISTPFTGDHSTISVSGGGPALWAQNRGAVPTLYVSTYSAAGASAMFACYNSSTSGSAGTLAFSVASNGNALNTNGSYGTISDLKLKQDIVPAKSQWDDIKTIAASMSKYRFKNDPTGPLLLGFIAQDLQKISPGLVEENNDIDPETRKETGEVTLSVKSSIVYMKAVKALGEALERIETLEARLAALENK